MLHQTSGLAPQSDCTHTRWRLCIDTGSIWDQPLLGGTHRLLTHSWQSVEAGDVIMSAMKCHERAGTGGASLSCHTRSPSGHSQGRAAGRACRTCVPLCSIPSLNRRRTSPVVSSKVSQSAGGSL